MIVHQSSAKVANACQWLSLVTATYPFTHWDSPHSHGRLKSSAPASGKGLPKMDTGMASSTQIAVAASKAGSRLVRWQFESDFDLDCSRDFFSCLARNFCSCCSCLILWASHLGKANSVFFHSNISSPGLTFFFASLLSHVCRGASSSWRRR